MEIETKNINCNVNLHFQVGDTCFVIDSNGGIDKLVVSGVVIEYNFGYGRDNPYYCRQHKNYNENGQVRKIQYTFMNPSQRCFIWDSSQLSSVNIFKTKEEVLKNYSNFVEGLI